MSGQKGGQVVLKLVIRYEVHEAVLMHSVVPVRYVHSPGASQSAHIKEAIVANGVEAARHDVSRGQVVERVHKERRDFGVEQMRQEVRLRRRIAFWILFCRSNVCRMSAILRSHQSVHLQT